MARFIPFGRSGAHRHSRFFQQYLNQISERYVPYTSTSTREIKRQLIEEVIVWVANEGGLFVEKEPNDNEAVVIVNDPKRIYEKVAQAFRGKRNRKLLLQIDGDEEEVLEEDVEEDMQGAMLTVQVAAAAENGMMGEVETDDIDGSEMGLGHNADVNEESVMEESEELSADTNWLHALLDASSEEETAEQALIMVEEDQVINSLHGLDDFVEETGLVELDDNTEMDLLLSPFPYSHLSEISDDESIATMIDGDEGNGDYAVIFEPASW